MKIKLTKIKNLIKDKINSLKKEKSSGKNDSIGSSGSIILTEYIDTNQSSDTIKQEEIGADKPRSYGGSGGAYGGSGGVVGGVGRVVYMVGATSQPQSGGYGISGSITIFNNSDKSFVDTYKCSCGKKIDFTYSFPRINDFRYTIHEQSKQD